MKQLISKPHFLMSAQNPKYPEHNKLGLSHEQVLTHLKGAGYNAHEVQGHYGSPEKSILVSGISPHHAEKLHNLASQLGQDSSIYSSGQKHEMRFHHGEDKGKKIHGEGTQFHSKKPDDYFTTLPTGEHFTHNFNFGKSETIPTSKKEFIKEHTRLLNVLDNPTPKKIKSEHDKQKAEAKQKAGLQHIEKAEDSSRMNLTHYSSQPNLEIIDPKFKGKGVDSGVKGRDTWHPHSFYYRAGTEPEQIVAQSAKHKYSTSIDTKTQPIYDIGQDSHGLHQQVRDENHGAFSMDNLHEKIKEKGYHGFHNSSHPSLSHVVVMYHPLKVESKEDLGKSDTLKEHWNKENAKPLKIPFSRPEKKPVSKHKPTDTPKMRTQTFGNKPNLPK